jgi:hypothetical protein
MKKLNNLHNENQNNVPSNNSVQNTKSVENQKEKRKEVTQKPNIPRTQKTVDQRIEDIFEQKKTDEAKLSYINSPINGIKQSPTQKKLNTMKYWEMVDVKVKKENAPLFRNHRKLNLPPPKKSIKQEYKSDIPLWVQVCNQPVGKIYNLRHFNNQF